jgi:hypothetical protein
MTVVPVARRFRGNRERARSPVTFSMPLRDNEHVAGPEITVVAPQPCALWSTALQI